MMKQHNFSPGPAILPPSVFQALAAGIVNYQDSGLSIAEISHLTPAFREVIGEATRLVRELYQVPSHWEILWLPGGASSQLSTAPMNLVNPDDTIAIVDTGYWSEKAYDAASAYCHVHRTDPERLDIPADAKYLHVVSNETIDGIQWHEFPDVNVPLVADMTSDFLSRPIPFEKFALIFASAQKNFGISGITCVLVNPTYISDSPTKIPAPKIFHYKTHIAEQSLYHTLPTVPVYSSLLMLRWIKDHGGVANMHQNAQQKAAIMYQEIDANPNFVGRAPLEKRSIANACFHGKSPEIEAQFLTFAEARGIYGIKGFSTIGGFRASMYNGMPIESVQYLVRIMQEFSAQALRK
jgi:phosphoserine aminotransferase